MNFFKKIAASVLTTLLVFMGIQASQAKTIKDVESDYWAYKEINQMILDGYMDVDAEGYFRPEESMTRVEFVDALIKVLGNENLQIKVGNKYKDINTSTPGYQSILRSDQIGLVYGYPDKTFKPERNMTRAETTSVVSHITKDASYDKSVLNQFKDKNAIPNWAIRSYAKAIKYGLYVNYPDELMLTPKSDLTRAEGAVLLAKIKNKLDLVKDKYKNQVVEKFRADEHIQVYDKAETNVVRVSNLRKIVVKGNVLRLAFCEKYNSKFVNEGDILEFYAPKDLYTVEGTLVYPQGTKFKAVVEKNINPKWFNRQAKLGVQFKTATYPNGKTVNISGVPLMYNGQLKEGKGAIAKKLGGYALGGGLIGAGVGTAIGAHDKNRHNIGGSIAIGAGVGAAIGAGAGTAIGLVTPGLYYKAKQDEEIYVYITEDSNFWN